MLFGDALYDDLQERIEIVIHDPQVAGMIATNVQQAMRRNPRMNIARDIENVIKVAAAGIGLSGAVLGQLTRVGYQWVNSASGQENKRPREVEVEADGGTKWQRLGDTEDSLPSLSQLIPESASDPTSGMTIRDWNHEAVHQRDRARLDARMADTNGDGDVDMGEAQLARAPGGGGAGPGNPVSKETPVSTYPSLSYGLQETHTTILPWCGYLSATGMVHTSPVVLELRMTQPHDVLATDASTVAAAAAWGKAINNVPFNNNTTRDTATASTFPATVPSGASATERASWFEFWRKQYEYYTVLGCEWEITVHNPGANRGTEIAVAWDYNTYSDTAGATGNKTPQDQTLNLFKQYKGLHWESLPISTDAAFGNSIKVLRGKYVPGMARRNIQNDGDVKTWIATNNGGTAAAPTLKEFLTLYFYRHELAYAKESAVTLGVNMQIKLKYIVQFKDLRVNARYPNTTDTDIALTLDTDVHQVPT